MFEHLKAVWSFRHFWMALVRLDLRQRYRRSVLGIGWSLLNPLAMTAVYCLVFSSLFGNGNWRDYAPYLLAGMAVWQFLTNSIVQGCTAFIRNESYIRQCPLPLGIYPLRAVMGTAIHFLISLFVVVALVAVLKQSFAVFGVLWAVAPAVVLLVMFAWALATLAGFATVYFHDTQHLVEVGTQMLFFLTPIFYTRKVLDAKNIGWLADMNPAFQFIEVIRGPLTGEPPSLVLMAQVSALTVVALGLAFGTIGWLQKKLIFQL
jgi:ABC-type polysaccharide/polyol phosphate export permease